MIDFRPTGRPALPFVLLLATMGSVACNPDSSITAFNNQPAQLAITVAAGGAVGQPAPASALELEVGQSAALVATALDALGQPVSSVSIVWSSTNTDAATVDANGLVQAVGAGTTEVVAEAGEVFESVTVTVSEAPGPPTTP